MNATLKLALTNSAVLFGIAMVSALLTDFAKTQRLPSIECLYYAFLTALFAFFVTLGHAKKRSRARKKNIRRLYQTTDREIQKIDQDIQKSKQILKKNRMEPIDFNFEKQMEPIFTNGPAMNLKYGRARLLRSFKNNGFYNDDDHELLCVVI